MPDSGVGYSRVTHPCATDPRSKLRFTVRLACLIHAASVHSEPGSNSPLQKACPAASRQTVSSFTRDPTDNPSQKDDRQQNLCRYIVLFSSQRATGKKITHNAGRDLFLTCTKITLSNCFIQAQTSVFYALFTAHIRLRSSSVSGKEALV